jgi:hypothetical protein
MWVSRKVLRRDAEVLAVAGVLTVIVEDIFLFSTKVLRRKGFLRGYA